MSDGTGHAIVARAVERRFGGVRALRGVDLEVARGSATVVFGSNGAGKTTLLRILAGLLRPSAGEVALLGQALPPGTELRRRIGVLGHETFLYGDLTGAENLGYYARLYGVYDRTHIGTLIAEVGLGDAAERPTRTYSRGMQQRLSLARAIVHAPELLLLDEPFSGLDAAGSDALAAVLTRARASGATLFLTTHDLQRGLGVADEVVVIERGRVAWRSDGDKPDLVTMRDICGRAARTD